MDVLVIDGVPILRQLVTDMLEEAELRAAAAADAAEALTVANDVAPAVLVVALHPFPGTAAPGGGGAAVNGGPAEAGRSLATVIGQRHGRPPPGLLYTGEHPALLGGHGLGVQERFLAEPFGRAALALAVYGLMGRAAPRWVTRLRRPAGARAEG